MKRKITFVCMAAALVGAFALGRAGAQEGTANIMDPKAWEALAAPGPEHAKMLKSVGTWNCECKCFEPGKEPQVTTSKVVRTAVLGRYVREEINGEMNGKPFAGIGYFAYNNATKTYECSWLDNGGTGIMFMTGTENELKGVFYGPGGVPVKCRAVTKHISDDQATMEMYNDFGMGGEMKCMEMTYTRVK
ncbi:MAG: DUF1579 domain-containing protein [Planctomycetota bacterium]|jgi:hypothetical protein